MILKFKSAHIKYRDQPLKIFNIPKKFRSQVAKIYGFKKLEFVINVFILWTALYKEEILITVHTIDLSFCMLTFYLRYAIFNILHIFCTNLFLSFIIFLSTFVIANGIDKQILAANSTTSMKACTWEWIKTDR